jgi:hypothetical protein
MSDDGMHQRPLSRRELIRIAGLGGLAATGASLIGPLARPLAASAASLQDDTPEGFLAAAYAQRAQAMSTGDTALLDALYDPSSATLLAFEKERARFYHTGLGPKWAGSQMLDYTTSAKLLDLTLSGGTATARIYARTTFQWIARPVSISAEAQAAHQRQPERYRLVPMGPRGEITSSVGTRHEITLIKGATGWRLAKDAFDERPIYLASPDLVPGSWAEIQRGGPEPGSIPAPAAADVASDPQLSMMATYNPSLAVQSAQSNCGVYNYQFCAYNSCGGDCANFVSQCFLAGGMPQGGGWGVSGPGGCRCGGSGYDGSNTWINNWMLRDWINDPNAGRGAPAPGGQDGWQHVGAGDIINYQFAYKGYQSEPDHVVIVSGWTASGPVICAHDTDHCNVFWDLGTCNYHNFSNVYAG